MENKTIYIVAWEYGGRDENDCGGGGFNWYPSTQRDDALRAFESEKQNCTGDDGWRVVFIELTPEYHAFKPEELTGTQRQRQLVTDVIDHWMWNNIERFDLAVQNGKHPYIKDFYGWKQWELVAD